MQSSTEIQSTAKDRGLQPALASPRLSDAKDWLLWQLADSAFPTGGFTHSGGLEAVWQHREITGGEDLFQLLAVALQQIGNSTLLFVVAAHQGTPSFAELDGLCEAFTSNHVANRASRLQGQSLLASAERSFATEALKQFRASVLEQQLPTHLAPVFGAVGRALGLERPATVRLFLFTQLRGLISSSVRLGVVGPFEGQSLQHRLGPHAERIAQDCGSLSLEDIAQTAPLLDLFQATQDRLYSRLFQS
ncbi:MAG: urease accessory UreF family protein [Verrucomicrobiota bacterium]